ncbi:MAG: transcriptional regulator, BadM/Rrf2 family [Mycobacterium sp.]|nr:transcriptional regulator, BadM/Rrf2 family [Mycobacterium sp.]MCW2744207.1 transcriptional regulator, BadM/Rrf2 family [Mycobacterium sp.]
MHISARVDYALRALLVLAAAEPGTLVKGDVIASSQGIPAKFCENILTELRRARLVTSQRGAEGGYRLAMDASTMTIGDVLRTIDGPLAEIRGNRLEQAEFPGQAQHLQTVWVAVRAALRSVLDATTLADVASGQYPEIVQQLAASPNAWVSR